MSTVRVKRYESAPVREVNFPPADVTFRRSPDGAMYVRPNYPLGPYADKLTERLDHWAAAAPDRVFLAERDENGEWRKVTYAQTAGRRLATSPGSARSRRYPPSGPSRFSPATISSTALLALGAMYAGIPFAPISPAYSLVSTDFGKLRHIFGLLTPGWFLFQPRADRIATRDSKRCCRPMRNSW